MSRIAAMLNIAARLRVPSAWDVETTSTVVVLRTLAPRAHAMLKEAGELQRGDLGHHPQLAPSPARGVRPRTDRRGHGVVRVVPPRPRPFRGGVRDARRRGTYPREQRPGHHAVPAEPVWGGSSTRYSTPSSRSGSSTNQPHVTTSLGRTAEGKTSREIKRCLARYVARDLYRLLKRGPQLLDEAWERRPSGSRPAGCLDCTGRSVQLRGSSASSAAVSSRPSWDVNCGFARVHWPRAEGGDADPCRQEQDAGGDG